MYSGFGVAISFIFKDLDPLVVSSVHIFVHLPLLQSHPKIG